MFHRTEVIGRVGRDPIIRFTASGQAVGNFSVAVTEKFKDKEHTTWYDVQVWGKLAELAGEYVTKGMLIFLDGRMNMREYEKDGVKHRAWELVANTMKFLGSKGDRSDSAPGESAQDDSNNSGCDEDDIPF
jgi:single-strand DNA-binding protein